MKVSLEKIEEASRLIRPTVKVTPVDLSRSLSEILGSEVHLKLENLQTTGSFKIRGALNKLAHLSEVEKSRGVIACSAGNHAQGVALAAKLQGCKSLIVMPVSASPVKVAATRGYGAEVVLFGSNFDEAKEHSHELGQKYSMTFVHPYEDESVVAGQGTLGLEMCDQIGEVDTVVVPIGGGGLISGVATAIKGRFPRTRVLGVQSEQAPGMHGLFHSGAAKLRKGPVRTIADGIAVKSPSEVMFKSFIDPLVDDIVTVSDAEIAFAQVLLLERVKTVAEASGAAGLAAALAGKCALGQKCAFVICGGNVDLNLMARILEKGLTQLGRRVRLSIVAADLPGQLNALTRILSDLNANVLEVRHDRESAGVYLKETLIEVTLETSGVDHIAEIKSRLREGGFVC